MRSRSFHTKLAVPLISYTLWTLEHHSNTPISDDVCGARGSCIPAGYSLCTGLLLTKQAPDLALEESR
jgi:hypothetical protein